MVTKTLLTLALLAVAIIIFLRRRKHDPEPAIIPATPAAGDDSRWMIRALAYTLLATFMVSATLVFYSRWQDGNTIHEIRITHAQTGKTDIYRAYKKDMKGLRFTTLNGQQVMVSGMERMESTPLQ